MQHSSNTTMRTPLSKVRGLGSAKSGTHHFWLQRMTAMSNAILGAYFIGVVWCIIGHPYDYARHVVGSAWVAIPLALFIVSFTTHMRLGLQVVIEDYVHTEVTKILLLFVNIFFSYAIAAACLFSLVKIALSA